MPSFCITIWLFSGFVCGEPKKLNTITVCELLTVLPAYKGKFVSVRGELFRTEEGSYLRDKQCPKHLITSGHVWPNMINLTPPDSSMVENRLAAAPCSSRQSIGRVIG